MAEMVDQKLFTQEELRVMTCVPLGVLWTRRARDHPLPRGGQDARPDGPPASSEDLPAPA
jgi:hypothetical protein